MFIRIQGEVTDISTMEGTSKSGRPWGKKTYSIKDGYRRNDDKDHHVNVDDMATLDPNSTTPIFIFHSNHIVGEKVDIACTIETNEYGFTNVKYFKSWDEFEKPQSDKEGNVTYAEPKQQEVEQPQETVADGSSTLPF